MGKNTNKVKGGYDNKTTTMDINSGSVLAENRQKPNNFKFVVGDTTEMH